MGGTGILLARGGMCSYGHARLRAVAEQLSWFG